MKLFEIVKDIAACIKRDDGDGYINTETGETLDEAALDALHMAKEQKLENIGKLILNLEAEEKALADQEARFHDRRVAKRKLRENLIDYTARNLNGQNFSCTACEFKFRKSEAVVFNGEIDKVPADYLRYKAPEIDKTKVKKALKAGEKIDGFTLEERQNLSVK